MAKYDVKCDTCGHIEEQEHGMMEDHEPCSKCGGKVSTYFGTAPAATFKGAGWTRKIKKDKPVEYKTRDDLGR